MTKLRTLLFGAVIAALYGAYALGQTIQPNALSGSECWNTGQGPGGPSTGFVCTNLLRGGTANAILSAVSGSFTIGAATGNFTNSGSPNMTALANGGNVIITAQPSAATITLPASPIADGSTVGICNGTNAAFATNVVTVAANTSQTLVPTGAAITLTTLAAASCVRYQWNQTAASWYKVQ